MVATGNLVPVGAAVGTAGLWQVFSTAVVQKMLEKKVWRTSLQNDNEMACLERSRGMAVLIGV